MPLPDPLPGRIQRWREQGERLEVGGNSIFTVDLGPRDAEALVIVHGFPGSSFDFAQTAALLSSRHRVVLFDLLGYGLSDKPRRAKYSLFEQADLVEALLAQLKVQRCVLLAHDMGDTVVAELLHRHNHGTLSFEPWRTILTNGSIFIDLARLTPGQRLGARAPGLALPFDVPRWILRRLVGESFARTAPPPAHAVDDLVTLVRTGGGSRLLVRQTQYLNERRANQPRWTAALVDYPSPLTAIWGTHDPIAVPAMAHRLVQLRPSTELVELDVGHWPSLEDPARLADEVAARL